jgi:hypothetical protein
MIIIVLLVYNVVLQPFPIFMPLTKGMKKWQMHVRLRSKNSLIVRRKEKIETKCKNWKA